MKKIAIALAWPLNSGGTLLISTMPIGPVPLHKIYKKMQNSETAKAAKKTGNLPIIAPTAPKATPTVVTHIRIFAPISVLDSESWASVISPFNFCAE